MKNLIIKLNEDDFRCLVSGGILTIKIRNSDDKVSMCLADIGFDRMDKAIEDADNGKLKHYTDMTKENIGWL